MQFESPLSEATFLRRYKRFLADFRLDDGTLLTAHCPNPGSMKSCLAPGSRAWLTKSNNPQRKLAYTWQLAEVSKSLIFVNPSLANDVVVDAIRAGRIRELGRYERLQREVRLHTGSRIDIVLHGQQTTYVEVKNVTLELERGRCAFPDSVTARGARHLRELLRLAQEGHRCVLFYCVGRQTALSVEPADAIDPMYGRALREAVRGGVRVIAYRCRFGRQGVDLEHEVEVRLPKLQ